MSEHKWLMEKEVEEYLDVGAFDRFTADWQKMRKLVLYLVLDALADARRRHTICGWHSLTDANAMLEATADD